MGAACCAGSSGAALTGSGGTGSLLALPLALLELGPEVSLVVVALVSTLLLGGWVLLFLLTPTDVPSVSSELQYHTHAGGPYPLPTLRDDPSIYLSVVVPAYNEAQRLPRMLTEALAYLDGKPTLAGRTVHTFEVILVDDGSSDDTRGAAMAFQRPEIRVVRLARNSGKGRAVRHGVLHARGELILFADADGATRFADIAKLGDALPRSTASGCAVAVGSRAHMVNTDAVVQRSPLRNALMHAFHLTLRLLLRPPIPSLSLSLSRPANSTVEPLPAQPVIQDTQCGFKLFTRPAARLLFPHAHIDRWIFDVELIVLAELATRASPAPTPPFNRDSPLADLPCPIAEVPVQWHEIDGSKIDLVRDAIRMALDLVVIRANYALGRWKAPGPVPGLPQPQACK